jgi:alanyl-tRNA synthetase
MQIPDALTASTRVTYPEGDTEGEGAILATVPLPDGAGSAVFVDTTPFHPLDHRWPDQPADKGSLRVDDLEIPVVDVVTAAFGPDRERLHLGPDIPVGRGADGWTFLVAHVADVADADLPAGARVALRVDAEYRARVNAAHTACHLMALALNEATAGSWHKDPPQRDSLGNPNLDALAIQSSRLEPLQSVDRYRFGKSLRKKGFDGRALPDGWSEIARAAEARIAEWVGTGAEVRLEGAGAALTSPRIWRCTLPQGEAAIPCGGSHVRSLAELGAVRLAAEPEEGGAELTMITVVTEDHRPS